MKAITLVGLVAFCATLSAAETPVYFKGQVRGTLVTGFTRREAIAVEPGRIVHCDRTGAGPTLTLYKCETEAATATVTDENGRKLSLSFEKVNVFYKSHQGGPYNEYTFTGTFRESGKEVPLSSEAKLVLWYYRATPSEINGFLSLPRYGLTAGLQATEMPAR